MAGSLEAEQLSQAFARHVLERLNKTTRPVITVDRYRMVISAADGDDEGATRWCELVLAPGASALRALETMKTLAQEQQQRQQLWAHATARGEHAEMSDSGLVERTVVVRMYPERPRFHPDTRQLFVRLGKGVALMVMALVVVLWIQP